MSATRRPGWWRPFARRRYDDIARGAAAVRWQRECYEWSRAHPGIPVMEAVVTRGGTAVVWNGPRPEGVRRS